MQQFSFGCCNVILKFQPVLMNTSITCKIGYFSNITYIISTIFILHRAPGLGFTLIDFIFSFIFIQQFSFGCCNVILKFQPVLMNTSITCKIGYFSNITYIISTIFILHRAPGLGFTLIDFIFSLYFYAAVFFRLL